MFVASACLFRSRFLSLFLFFIFISDNFLLTGIERILSGRPGCAATPAPTQKNAVLANIDSSTLELPEGNPVFFFVQNYVKKICAYIKQTKTQLLIFSFKASYLDFQWRAPGTD